MVRKPNTVHGPLLPPPYLLNESESACQGGRSVGKDGTELPILPTQAGTEKELPLPGSAPGRNHPPRQETVGLRASSEMTEKHVWYLAIASMMNPQKLVDRGLRPLESFPCRCVGFERRFWGKYGMAEIREKEGAEFHAVLHLMTETDLRRLDELERGYERVDVVCYKYDGTKIIGSGYQFNIGTLMYNGYTPPSERYLNLCVEGMEHFGVNPAAIAEMRATPTQGPGTQ
eukprot:1178002-Prorocentrum_minimum.AAC.3